MFGFWLASVLADVVVEILLLLEGAIAVGTRQVRVKNLIVLLLVRWQVQQQVLRVDECLRTIRTAHMHDESWLASRSPFDRVALFRRGARHQTDFKRG